jgi:hypothetical protein
MARDWSTFFQTCIYICILLIILTFAISFINELNLFYDVNVGVETTNKPNNFLEELTGFEGGMEYIWLALITSSGLGTLVVAKLTQSTNMIGVWLFTSIFWTSYNKCLSVINISYGSQEWIPAEFLIMFTVALLFLWIAAVIGMLTGSG